MSGILQDIYQGPAGPAGASGSGGGSPLCLDREPEVIEPIIQSQSIYTPQWIDVPHNAADFEDFNNPGGFIVNPGPLFPFVYQYYVQNNIMAVHILLCVCTVAAGNLLGVRVPAGQIDPADPRTSLNSVSFGTALINGGVQIIFCLEQNRDWIYLSPAPPAPFAAGNYDYFKGTIIFQK